MAAEHERKFLLLSDSWRGSVSSSSLIIQGYLQQQKNCSVRVRLSNHTKATLNIKSATIGVSRQEFEYDIPVADAQQMLDSLCSKPLLEKTRHLISHQGNHWEIDEFSGDNDGLVVAELELEHPQQAFAKPPWLGREVSEDSRYYNTSLQQEPYSTWESTD